VILSLDEALITGLIESENGKIDQIKIASAEIKVFPEFSGKADKMRPINFEDAIITGLFDIERAVFHHPRTWKTMSLAEAVQDGAIAGDASIITDPNNGDKMTLAEAIRKNVIDGVTGMFNDNKLNRRISLNEAIETGLIEHAYSHDSSVILDWENNRLLSLEEAIRHAIISSHCVAVLDIEANQWMSIEHAVEIVLLNRNTGKYGDLSAEEAAKRGFISIPGAPILAGSRHSSQSMHKDMKGDAKASRGQNSLETEATLNCQEITRDGTAMMTSTDEDRVIT